MNFPRRGKESDKSEKMEQNQFWPKLRSLEYYRSYGRIYVPSSRRKQPTTDMHLRQNIKKIQNKNNVMGPLKSIACPRSASTAPDHEADFIIKDLLNLVQQKCF